MCFGVTLKLLQRIPLELNLERTTMVAFRVSGPSLLRLRVFTSPTHEEIRSASALHVESIEKVVKASQYFGAVEVLEVFWKC